MVWPNMSVVSGGMDSKAAQRSIRTTCEVIKGQLWIALGESTEPLTDCVNRFLQAEGFSRSASSRPMYVHHL